MFRVIVASDKFKGSLTSAEVATAVGVGLRRVHPDTTVVPIPVADGGDGTLTAAVTAGFTLVPVTATGPTGEPVPTGYAHDPVPAAPTNGRGAGAASARGGSGTRGESGACGDVAVVELADVCGLVRLPGGRRAPMGASSRGAGEVIAAALDAGCRKITLGIGGSASTDGGVGLVQALGARLVGGDLASATSLDLTALRRRLEGVEVVVACDVDNPLTGPDGAAAVYGPQKGADQAQVAELDARLSRWADLVARETGKDLRDEPGAGAAGGVGFAALALLGAELRPGIDLVLELVGFHEQLAGADLVITGEGALDDQTLHGKAVAGVAAGAKDIPVVAVCGVNHLEPQQLRNAGVRAAYALTELEPDVNRCIAEPRPLLERIGERIAVEHLTMTATERGIA
ncbi:glycerate kinase [Kribbella sp. NPDC026596]|uniref:glycerate kinase n=1 Tax=Kribbella sp. NPDC026596 TaxID=3155122 RepID=UPI003400483C